MCREQRRVKVRMNKYVNSENGVSSLMAVISLTLLMVIVGGIATMTIANSHENKNNKDNKDNNKRTH